jgi:hypothetical protein
MSESKGEIDIQDKVEVVEIDELLPYSNNPKEHPDEQVEKIASSIKNFGWDQPIVVDADNEIIKGHGRFKAAKRLGLDEVPIIRQEDLSDAEARAARIADNKTAESPWDDELLATEVDMITDVDDIDETALGFDDDELDDVLDMASPPEPDFDDADIDEENGEVENELNVVVVAPDEDEAEAIGEWADSEGYEWHVVDR